MLQNIKRVDILTPVYNESLETIQDVEHGVAKARNILHRNGIKTRHYFLNDGSKNLPWDYPALVRHNPNLGIAHTLTEGFEAASLLIEQADLVIKIDAQEHDPALIPAIVDHFAHTQLDVLFLPVFYWVEGQPRPRRCELEPIITAFVQALHPIDRQTILGIYNSKFPMGYQAYRMPVLVELLPQIKEALALYAEVNGDRATWGIDLINMLLAAARDPERIDFMFGGYMQPWLENRGREKVEEQKLRATKMLDIAVRLGCQGLEVPQAGKVH